MIFGAIFTLEVFTLRNRKKLILPIVLLLICMLLSTACTGGGEGTTAPSGTEAPAPGTTAAPQTDEITEEVTTAEATTAEETTEAPPPETTEDISTPAKPKIAVLSGAGASTKIYSKMVEMTGKTNPKCLIITAAGKDGVDTIESYGNTMRKYTKNVEFLTLCTKYYTEEELRELILGADMILEVGGQSEFMQEAWEKFGLPAILTEAYNNGVVICGGSAGGMCWTYAAWNDFYELPESIYKWFYGIDVLNFYYGSHHHDNAQWTLFHNALLEITDPKYPIGYAMDSGTGIVVIDGEVVEYLRENGKNAAFIWKYTFADGKWTRVKISKYS